MVKNVAAGLAATLALGACEAGGPLGEVLSGIGASQALSEAEIDAGLRQALELGTGTVAAQLGAVDGFFGDPRIKIPLPGVLGDAQRNLASVGLSAPLDDLQLRMNRAAESAMPVAKNLVVDAVRSITIEDALSILQGGDTAATDFLRKRTEAELIAAFSPRLDAALAEAGAFQALDSAAGRAGLGGAVGQLRNDVVDQATAVGLDGVFLYLAEQERDIRENPAARTTDLLRRVFGSVA